MLISYWFDKLPWKIQRAFSLVLGNVRSLSSFWTRWFGRPKYKIMISTAFFGGVGGTEKHLKAIVESMPDSVFDIKARQIKPYGFLPKTWNYSLNIPLFGKVHYDLYIYFAGGGRPELQLDRYVFKRSLIVTNGADIRDIEEEFDKVAIQTGNFRDYCRLEEKAVLMFPFVKPFFPRNKKKLELPEKYFITVFNPFSSELKGGDVLFKVADQSALPIVWCFSDKSGLKFEDLPDHPNVIKKPNLSQEELYYSYGEAVAYISFSNKESFGWSLAEAFYSDLPIISKEVGFLTYVKEQQGVNIYETEDELVGFLRKSDYQRSKYDDSLFKNNTYPLAIGKILSEH